MPAEYMPADHMRSRASNYSPPKEPIAIGGWLWLIAIGLVITPPSIARFIYTVYVPLFNDGTWALFTVPGSELYTPLWGSLIIAEVIANVIIGVVYLYMAFLFFSKKSSFPKWFAGITVFSALFLMNDTIAISFMFPDEPMFDPETIQEFLRTFISLVAWIPYLYISERSKDTFVL